MAALSQPGDCGVTTLKCRDVALGSTEFEPSSPGVMVSRNSPRPAGGNAASTRRAVDHRDQIIGATLVGTVLVLLGYASGIGGGGGTAQAAGGPGPGVIARAPSPSSSEPSPGIVQATGGSD